MTQPSLEWGAQPDADPRKQVMVALDLETTGVDPARDRIIEVGAVKFRGDEVLATFSTLVNPFTKLNRYVAALTGIRQADLDRAPSWGAVADGVARFIGSFPIVGHRVSFDIGFLQSHGLSPGATVYDTFELASVVLPEGPEYSLIGLSSRLRARHDSPHRAPSDAEATQGVFLALLEELARLDAGVLAGLQRLGARARWSVGELAGRLLAARPPAERRGALSALGIDPRALAQRLRARPSDRSRVDLDATALPSMADVFGGDGRLGDVLPGFEYRAEQLSMATAVTGAFTRGEHLVVEAGTGVGKSLAYLVPAALHALSGQGSVVVSTNTINLQRQLFEKDIPALEAVLSTLGIPAGALRVAELKGRANYLCFKRWAHAQTASEPDASQARVLGKCLTWIQDTETGDRAELNLPGIDAALFTRLSAQGAASCPAPEGPCFLRRARYAAHSADIVIVNHSLLLSDLAMGGGLIPSHSALVIDEAHHLERVATRHLGFAVSQNQMEAELRSLEGDRGIIADALRTALAAGVGAAQEESLARTASGVQSALQGARRSLRGFFETLGRLLAGLAGRSGRAVELRVTRGVRAQPAWSELEVAWENASLAVSAVATGLAELAEAVPRVVARRSDAVDAVALNLSAVSDFAGECVAGLRQAIHEPRSDMIYWLSMRGDGSSTVQAAPLNIGPLLAESLFANERCVVLTSGTLAYGGSLERLRASLGVEDGSDLVLGSPFDYRKAALVAIPEDVPEPSRPGYGRGVHDALQRLASATRDRMLVLFTSVSSMIAAREALLEPLRAEGIRVIAQGIDGPPRRVMRALAEKRETVALGTNSLWEGVDLERASIKVLVMTRLPFPVPSEPVFEARSEQYENGFNDYAVPEAVMRFRQGFGRLIRSRRDRGVFVVLDSRIVARSYGARFLRALPDCAVTRLTSRALGAAARDWLK